MKHKITKKGIRDRLYHLREKIYREDIKTFAKRMRYSTQHIYKMENEGFVSSNMIMQLAEEGININWLLTGIGNPKNDDTLIIKKLIYAVLDCYNINGSLSQEYYKHLKLENLTIGEWKKIKSFLENY